MSKRVKKEILEDSQDEPKSSKDKRRKWSYNKPFDAFYPSHKRIKEGINTNEMKHEDIANRFSPNFNIVGHETGKIDVSKSESECNIKESVVYYEKILHCLKQELDNKEIFAYNSLKESEGKEVDLSCHATTSHCLELLLTHCREEDVMQRFMSAFAEQKMTVCTSSNASHITELLIGVAFKSIQNWVEIMDSEDEEGKKSVTYNLTWLTEFGEFILDNLNDFLSNTYSCHVICTLVQAFGGDMSKFSKFRSKSSKFHKNQFYSQYTETIEGSANAEQNSVLDSVPKFFKKLLKRLSSSLIGFENVLDLVRDGSTTPIIEALLCALKRVLPKACKKMIVQLAETIFSEKNQDNIPLSILHRNCSFVVEHMFRTAEDDLQVQLWNGYIECCLGPLVAHPSGHFVIKTVFEVVSNKSVFEQISDSIWCHFDEILKSQSYGIFLSIANACNRLSAQQSSFVKHIMLCLQCDEPEERQRFFLPLLVGFQKYDDDFAARNSLHNFYVCLHGSLVAQEVLKFHRPFRIVHSIINMPPEAIEFLAGHIQGCHTLNAFFGSISVGEKNKEKLLNKMKPLLVSVASDRNKSHTLSRIWTLLSLKHKEVVARELAEKKHILVESRCGYGLCKKFGIHYFKNLPEWRRIQNEAPYNKNTRKQ